MWKVKLRLVKAFSDVRRFSYQCSDEVEARKVKFVADSEIFPFSCQKVFLFPHFACESLSFVRSETSQRDYFCPLTTLFHRMFFVLRAACRTFVP